MKSKIEEAALLLLIAGKAVSKFDVAEQAGCTPLSAQRKLFSMHKAGVMRVSAWTKNGDRNVPVYKADGKRDVAAPEPVPSKERCRRQYAKKAVEYLVKQRAKRLIKTLDEGKISYATNPYGLLYRIADQHINRVCD